MDAGENCSPSMAGETFHKSPGFISNKMFYGEKNPCCCSLFIFKCKNVTKF